MSGTAEYLREAREQKGLTLEQVEEATRIPRYYLEILEGGGDDRLVSDRLYMVHFLRNYAAFLEVQEETLAARFLHENRQPKTTPIIPTRKPRSWKAVLTATPTLLLAIGIGAYLYDPVLLSLVGKPTQHLVTRSDRAPTRPETTQPPAPAAPSRADDAESSVLQPEANETDPSTPRLVANPPGSEPEPASEAAAAGSGSAPTDLGVSSPTSSLNPAAPLPPALETTATDAATSRAPASTTAPDVAALQGGETATETTAPGGPQSPRESLATTAAEPSAGHRLTIFAEEKAWLRVWVDDEGFKDMMLDPEETLTLSAQTHFVITFGNAGGVRLVLNGEELPPAGRSGQVVRNFRIPPDS